LRAHASDCCVSYRDRHLSAELDETSATAEELKEENQRMHRDKTVLEEEVATLRAALQSKDAVSSELQRRMAAFQAAIETREAALKDEVAKLKGALRANEMELEQRDRRINRLTSSVDDMEEVRARSA
jgi:chromosome segregation ATPase